MKKLVLILSIAIVSVSSISCEKDDEVGGSTESRAIGKWTVVGFRTSGTPDAVTECFKKGTLEINSNGTFTRTTFTNETDCVADAERTGSGTYTYDADTDDFLFTYQGSTEVHVADMTTIFDADEMDFLERPAQGTGEVLAVYAYQRN